MPNTLNNRRVIIPACPHCGRSATIAGNEDMRELTLRFRVTESERDTIQVHAAEAGLTMSQYIRSKIL